MIKFHYDHNNVWYFSFKIFELSFTAWFYFRLKCNNKKVVFFCTLNLVSNIGKVQNLTSGLRNSGNSCISSNLPTQNSIDIQDYRFMKKKLILYEKLMKEFDDCFVTQGLNIGVNLLLPFNHLWKEILIFLVILPPPWPRCKKSCWQLDFSIKWSYYLK